MNFKKIAIVAALLASTSAFAVTEIDDLTVYADGTEVNLLDVAEFAALGTLAGDGNYATIHQTGEGNIAYIDQEGAALLNYASVVQIDDAAIGIVYQIGGTNRAAIYTH